LIFDWERAKSVMRCRSLPPHSPLTLPGLAGEVTRSRVRLMTDEGDSSDSDAGGASAGEPYSGRYGLARSTTPPDVFAVHEAELEDLEGYFSKPFVVARTKASSASASVATLKQVARQFVGFCFHIRKRREGSVALLLDGRLIQSYVAFLRARSLAMGTIVKELGGVSVGL
jgi:hypothetical protein